MVQAILTGCILYLFWILYKWTQEKTNEEAYNDYSNPKAPLYVYYNTSGIPLPLPLYFIGSSLLSILIGGIFNKVMDNLIAAIMLSAILIYASKQYVIIRSIRNSQAIDEDCPSFLITYSSLLKTINNPLYALEHAAKYAHKSYRKTLEILHIRLANGADAYEEIEKAKKYFRNRILRSFLDDLEEELRRGNILSITIDRFIDRAQDRKKYATERKIETYAGVIIIYAGLCLEFILGLFAYFFKPEWFEAFTTFSLGKIAVTLIVAVSGFMLIAAQRLILLGEG